MPQREIIDYCKRKWKKRTLISTATEGWIRYEWAAARYSQIVPMNWEASGFDIAYTTIGFNIDDAYNTIVKKAFELDVEWLITIEDDVLIPPDLFVKLHDYTTKGDIPVVSGLYYLKASPTQPLIFRGRGNGAFTKFKIGEKVWCDGIPMGCMLLHTSILKWMWEHTEEYKAADGSKLHRVFRTPQRVFYDPEFNGYGRQVGTQDLYFCDQLIENKVLEKTGWKNIAKKQYPFLVDTSIFCRHIDRSTGRQYP
jgi:hypothetical protein